MVSNRRKIRPPKGFSVHLTSEKIQEIVKNLADKINDYYLSNFPGRSVILVIVLNGASMFASDLQKLLKFKCIIDYIKVKSYPENQEHAGDDFKILYDIDNKRKMRGKCVLVLDELADTCRSIEQIEKHLSKRKPHNLKNCVAFRKVGAQTHNGRLDFVGEDIPNEWVVGYGLDGKRGAYRNLPFLAIKKKPVKTGKSPAQRDLIL